MARITLHDSHQRARARRDLCRADPRLGAWILRAGDIWSPRTVTLFELLCRIVIDQQISVKAGATIAGRLRDGCGGAVRAASIDRLDDQELRACGLSRQKAATLRAISTATLDHRLKLDQLWRLDDEEAAARIMEIKGLGPWSAEMFLMFGLGRPDVFSVGDLGLRNAIARLHHDGAPIEQTHMVEASEAWRPWRTLACRYLWAYIEPAFWGVKAD